MIEIARQFRKQPTPSEAILWSALRGCQLDGRKFRRQQPIGPFVVDFFCAAERLIVEVDGPIHETQRDVDEQRQRLLESLGFRFVRLAASQIENNLPAALETIRHAFTQTRPSPPAPSSIKGEGGNATPSFPSWEQGPGE
jgi:adenine-specific DNA-methyltransferase